MAFSLALVGWIGAILCTLLWFVTINLVMCYYRLLPHEEALQNRKPEIVLIMGYLAVIYMTLKPIVILLIFGVINDPFIMSHGSTFTYTFVTILTLPIFYLSIYRGYKIYFDIQFNQALQDAEWRMFINPTETNWFLKNKTKWGDGKRVAIILLIIYCTFSLVGIIRTWFIVGIADTISRYILGVHFLILTSFGLILYCKFPAFDDVWCVRKEIQLSSLSTSVVVFIYLGFTAIFKLQPDSPYYVFVLYMAIVVTMLPILSSMLWVFRQFNLPWNIFDLGKHRQLKHHSQYADREGADVHKIRHILQDDNGFNLFARHLTKEFSMENMLFVLETQQWIHFILGLHQENPYSVANSNQSSAFVELCSIKFPDNVPKSSIIQSPVHVSAEEEITVEMDDMNQTALTDEDKVYLCAVEIFQKYIINRAYFCINISYDHRAQLYALFGWNDSKQSIESVMVKHLKERDLSLLELMHIFDDVRIEVYKLMANGFRRFKVTGEYLRHHDELPAFSPVGK
eukprot:351033_1